MNSMWIVKLLSVMNVYLNTTLEQGLKIYKSKMH